MVLGVAWSDLVEVDLQQQWLQQGVSRSEATTAVVQSLTVRGAAVVVAVDRLGRLAVECGRARRAVETSLGDRLGCIVELPRAATTLSGGGCNILGARRQPSAHPGDNRNGRGLSKRAQAQQNGRSMRT